MNTYLYMEYFNGFIVGSVETIVGHPLDTIKVRLQFQNGYHFKHLYNGFTAPFLSNSFISAGLFGINEQIHKNVNNFFVSGFLSGMCISLVLSPIEAIKTHRQQMLNVKLQLFRGFPLTVLREAPSMSVYFGTFHYLKNNGWNPHVNGAITGMLTWGITYPIDVAKTRVQSNYLLSYKQAFRSNLFDGFYVCMFRAAIVNSCALWAYSFISK